MPGFNGTGPQGAGSMTGRGMGNCGNGQGQGFGRGFGRGIGRGFGRGLGRIFDFSNRQPTKAEETASTKSYIEDLKVELSGAEEYLKDIGGKK
ncbi:DUF5320 domain-containing protein [Patescibacteria group bacterium]|nr:DUF5320 domain-containing protein [Patescibacteria group bacterium]